MTSWCILLVVCAFVTEQPANDLCSNAIPIPSIPFSFSDTTIGAGRESRCYDTLTAGDVWFSYTPSTSIQVYISLCRGTNYDSVIYLAAGSCTSLACLSRNDEIGCGSGPSYLDAQQLVAGTTYYIIISGGSLHGADAGTYTLDVVSMGETTPGCTVAITVPSLPYSYSGAITSGDPSPRPCKGGDYYSDWFAYTPPFTGSVVFSIEASFNSYLILQSNCGASFCLATGFSSIEQTLTAGVPYFLIVTTYSSTGLGAFTLSIAFSVPSNDNCAAAILIPNIPRKQW